MNSDQCFLIDEKVINDICNFAEIKEGERILEIGAGSGNLTEMLLKRRAIVFAVEIDSTLVAKLKRRFKKELSKKKIEVICCDILKLSAFPRIDKIVSSLPYSISRKLTERILKEKFNSAVLVYQKEFAKKLTAKPCAPNYRYITALVRSSCSEVNTLMEISSKAFDPPPHVISSVVKLTQRSVCEDNYMKFLKELFNHRNKTLKKSLKKICSKDIEISDNLLSKRCFELSPSELKGIYDKNQFILNN